jgi:hypothetical protein
MSGNFYQEQFFDLLEELNHLVEEKDLEQKLVSLALQGNSVVLRCQYFQLKKEYDGSEFDCLIESIRKFFKESQEALKTVDTNNRLSEQSKSLIASIRRCQTRLEEFINDITALASENPKSQESSNKESESPQSNIVPDLERIDFCDTDSHESNESDGILQTKGEFLERYAIDLLKRRARCKGETAKNSVRRCSSEMRPLRRQLSCIHHWIARGDLHPSKELTLIDVWNYVTTHTSHPMQFLNVQKHLRTILSQHAHPEMYLIEMMSASPEDPIALEIARLFLRDKINLDNEDVYSQDIDLHREQSLTAWLKLWKAVQTMMLDGGEPFRRCLMEASPILTEKVSKIKFK